MATHAPNPGLGVNPAHVTRAVILSGDAKMADDNITLTLRWFEEIWNQRRPEVIGELAAADSVFHDEGGDICGPDEFRERYYVPLTAAFPDLRVEVTSIMARGDEVAVRWCASGIHGGDGLGFGPTNRGCLFRGMTWISIRDGQFAEGWQHSNIAEVIRELSSS